MNINGEFSLCNKVEKNIDHIFISCDLNFNVQSTIHTHCPSPINTNCMWTDLNIFG